MRSTAGGLRPWRNLLESSSVAQCLDVSRLTGRLLVPGSLFTTPVSHRQASASATPLSRQRADEVQDHAGRAAGAERRDHAELETEDHDGGGDRKHQRPWIDARYLR